MIQSWWQKITGKHVVSHFRDTTEKTHLIFNKHMIQKLHGEIFLSYQILNIRIRHSFWKSFKKYCT